MNVNLTTIRYYTAASVYHYTLDNEPLQDLASNDELILQATENLYSNQSGDVGDADYSVPSGARNSVLYHSPVTSNHAVALNETNPSAGDSVRIIRSSTATGSFTLNATATGLTGKNLDAGEWIDYEYFGGSLNSWIQTGFGNL